MVRKVNKRIERLNMAKRLLEIDRGATAEQIAAVIRGKERARPDTCRPIGEYLLKAFNKNER